MLEIKEKAEQDALNDWNSKTAFKLFPGEIYSNEPIIDSCGFYVSCSGEGNEYIRIYNSTLTDLLEKHGIPDWAPGARKLQESDIPELFLRSQNISNLELQDRDDRKLIRRQLLLWVDRHGCEPSSYIRLKDKELIVFFGTINNELKVDVIDMSFKTRMQTFLLDKY